MKILKLIGVSKYYKSAETVSVGMKNVNASFDIGEFIAVTGESGSGKSTLLNVISGLDGYEEGELYYYGEETSHFMISDWERYRSANVGFVFQNYNIIDSYTVFQNVMFALEIQGYPRSERRKRAYELIDKVGLTSHRHHKASKLSGGQKQRAVIARALAKDCPVIVADEPTGNLDSASAKQIMALLNEISKDKLVIVVTHDYDQIKDYATRKIKMHDGEIVEDIKIKEPQPPIKVELKPKRVSFLTLIRISLRNIFAMPKKTIFLLLMQMVAIGVFTLVYSNQMKQIKEVGLTQSYVYPSVPETRLIVEKRDGSAFLPAEISRFKANKNVIEVYENHSLFFNNSRIRIAKDNYDYGRNVSKTDSAIILKKGDVDGNIPQEINEVVVSNYWGTFEIGDIITLKAEGDFHDVTLIPGEFKVVGIDKKDRDTLYFSEKYLKQELTSDYALNYSKYKQVEQAIFASYFYTEYLGKEYRIDYLSESESSFDIVEARYPMPSSPTTSVYNDVSLIIKLNYNGNILDKELTGLSIQLINEDTDGDIKMFRLKGLLYDGLIESFLLDLESEYMEYTRNKIVLEVASYYAGNRVIKTINNDLYKVYYPANINSPLKEIYVFLISLFSIVFLTLFGMFLYSMVHAVTKNVVASRKKDFAIYRSVGANQSALARMVVIEQIILNVFGFIFVGVILNLLKNNFAMLEKSLPYMQPRDYLILLVVFALFGLWIGLRFNKRVFQQSVIETLTASKEDF